MSIFGSIGKFFKKILDSIMSLVKKILDALGPLLPLLIIAAFVFAPYIADYLAAWGFPVGSEIFAAVYTTISAYGEYAMLAVGIGAAFLIAPEESTKLVGQVGSVIGTAVGAVGGAIGSAIGGTVKGVASSLGIWLYVALGFGAYMVLKDD